ncbi:MAG: NYN domain-containing protein, partial [Patescibacteria group bacterium]
FLRRFYYGSDYGKNDNSQTISLWSEKILSSANMSGFEVVTKRVKYIHNLNNKFGFDKKCDLDVEMTVDLIKERDNYDNIILFSGDGDLMCAIKYLKEEYNKTCFVFGARGHIGREIFDMRNKGIVNDVLFADDFEYRLNMDRFRR